MKIQERYQRAVDEFVRRAVGEYKDRIDEIILFGSVASIEELYAKSLTKAQTKREKADYDIYYDPSKEEAESIIEDAENFLVRIKVAISNTTQKTMTLILASHS